MRYRIGVDIGGTGIKIGLVDENNQIVNRHSLPTGAERPYLSVVEDIVKGIAAVKGDISYKEIISVGVGCPGFVNPETGLLVHAGNLNWENVPLKDALESRMGLPVYVGNDANCAVVGETVAGAAKGKRNVMLITLGTGVGGGLILNGKLFTGSMGMGAELGHAILVMDGEPCTCGIRGCFEAYASVSALIRQTKEMMERCPDSAMHEFSQKNARIDGRTAFDCARMGDEAAKRVVEQYIRYVAAGIGSQINVFRPEAVLIGGGISAEGDHLIKPLNEMVGEYVFAFKQVGAPPILKASLGNDAGIIGAAYLDAVS